jgi:hypothetical protein
VNITQAYDEITTAIFEKFKDTNKRIAWESVHETSLRFIREANTSDDERKELRKKYPTAVKIEGPYSGLLY